MISLMMIQVVQPTKQELDFIIILVNMPRSILSMAIGVVSIIMERLNILPIPMYA